MLQKNTEENTAAVVETERQIKITRSLIDRVLIGFGVLLTAVFAVAGGLLMWGSNFAGDYVHDQLAAQKISFGSAQSLTDGGREDLVKYADQQVDSGKEAEAYASFIAGHIDAIGGGMTYSELGGPEREAKAAVQTAKDNGASQAEIDELQATATAATATRDTVFKGEMLRGTLLNAYAWDTVGNIAGIAAWAAFAAAAVSLVMVIFGLIHVRRHHRHLNA